jgi:energy-coupling factor transporter ATP-binding protein EcfA2
MMTSMTNLKSLSISGLRGVSNPLTINFDKPFTLIFGHNGTGKTSICDAIDFLANGDCGSLGDNSVGSFRHKFWPFIGKKSSDVAVDLSLSDGSSWRATISGTKSLVSASSTRGIPAVKVWRRKQMMDLILAKPLERFNVIAEFIDVEEIEASEKVVRDLQRNIDRQLQDAASKIAENYATLADQCRIAGGDETSLLKWAETESKKSSNEFDIEIRVFSNLNQKLESLASCLKTLDELQKAGVTLKQNLDTAEDNYEKAKSSITDGASDTLALLSEAKKYFESKGNINVCPLCESAENASGLAEKVTDVLETYSELSGAELQFKDSKKQHEFHTTKESEQSNIKKEHIEDLSKCLDSFAYENNSLQEFKSLLLTSDSLEITKLSELHESLTQHKDALVRSKGLRDTIEAAYNQYQTNLESQSNNSTLKPKIDRLLDIHEQKRKAFVDDILVSIAGEVGRLYEAIHPGEGLDTISLQLDPKKRSSLDIQSKFLDQDAPPGAYFSNSHLDSLGLCILLALAKRESPENTVLILDDVLGSIDEPHAERIIRLIYDESNNFMHTLVTTHYQRWHAKILTGHLKADNCQLIELEEWNPSLGVLIRTSARSQVERLRDCVVNRSNEPEQIAQQAGYLLEMVCDWLVSKYELSIPKRKNTANDYLNALKEKYSKQLKVEKRQDDGSYVETELKQLLADIRNLFQIRNIVGAHFNELASHLTAADSLDFGKKVLELSDLLICKDEGFPVREKLTYLSTPSETRRLYPLRMNR